MAKHLYTTTPSSAGSVRVGTARAVEPVVQAARAIDPVVEATTVKPVPEPAQIARLAYEYWQARGCPGGSPEEDWFRAESELKTQGTRAET